MLKHATILSALCYLIAAEVPVQATKSASVLSSAEPHTFFNFIRPGLTQTTFAFGGPSSYQSFFANIGNPQLVQRVLPILAQALVYRNPGLGYYPNAPIANGYGIAPTFTTHTASPLGYQAVLDSASALAYIQQLQQQQQTYLNGYQPNTIYQTQLAQMLTSKQAQLQQEQLHSVESQK